MRTSNATDGEFKALFNSEQGRKVLSDIYTECGYGEIVFNKDPQQNAFNQGKQSVAIFLKRKLTKKD